MPETIKGPASVNINLMKKLDAVIGRSIVKFIPRPALKSLDDVSSVLFIRPGGIGDAVHLIPAIKALLSRFPNAAVDIISEKRNAGIFLLTSGIRRLYHYDNPLEFMQVMLNSYDVIIDTEQWHCLSAVVCRFIRSSMKIGFDTGKRTGMFTHTVPYSHDDYETDSFFRLLEPLGISAMRDGLHFLKIPDHARQRAGQLIAPLNKRQFVVIFPGASIPERRWGGERFRKCAELLSQLEIPVVVVGGKNESEDGNIIISGGDGINLAGITSLAETAAVIERSALLVSGDSGVLHIAFALGKPTVSLFGSGRARKWAPTGDSHIVINRELPCSPCTTFGTTPRCDLNAQCMKEINADEVFNAVTILLTSEGILQKLCCKREWIEIPEKVQVER